MKMSKNKFNEFRDYCNAFYGEGGTYSLGCSEADIEVAIYVYLGKLQVNSISDWMEWGEGDSVDRERVRYILEEYFNFSEK
jgi:hypothetical protein